MTDTLGGYTPSFRPKKLSRRELDKMRKIMKTVPLVKARNDIHHEQEEIEADQMFEKKIVDLEN